MEKPTGIRQAIIGIWITIGLSVLAALISKWFGEVSIGYFVFSIVICALYCIFPYKIGAGSNPARYVYTVLVAVSIISMLGGIGSKLTKAELIITILTIPVDLFVLFRLFQPEASTWFGSNKSS